jgi:hypothetical protein
VLYSLRTYLLTRPHSPYQVRSFGARRLYAMLQHSVRPCQQWIRQLEAMLRRAREDCRALVTAFGEDGGEGGPKMEHAAQQLLAVAADFVAAAEKAERDNQRERGLAHVLGQLREVQQGLTSPLTSPQPKASPEAAPGPGAGAESGAPLLGNNPPPPPPPPPPPLSLETPPLPAAVAAAPSADEPAPSADPDALLLQRARPPVARRVKSGARRVGAGGSNENTEEPPVPPPAEEPPLVRRVSSESPGYSEEYF